MTIVSQGSGCGILIEDSSEYFLIRNCSISNFSSNPSPDAGIKFKNTSNGTIISNNLTNNGIWLLEYSKNNTILDNFLLNNTDGAIYLNNHCNNNTISNNTITCSKGGAMMLVYSDNNNISKNTLISYNNGIYLSNCINTTVVSNKMSGNGGLDIRGNFAQVSSCRVINNTINNKPIYYYVHEKGLDANSFRRAGQVILINCSNSLISNLNVSHTSTGLYLHSSVNNTISNITAKEIITFGIVLVTECNNNSISESLINGADRGIHLGDNCDDNEIFLNKVNNSNRGIYLRSDCFNNEVLNNTLKNNLYGISLYESSDNSFLENIIYNNTRNGIDLDYYSDYNNFTKNRIIDNMLVGAYIDDNCKNNLFYKNFFIGNGENAKDDGNNNEWNSSSIGNYWDNYTEMGSGAVDANNDGIGDIPYNVSGSAKEKDLLPIFDILHPFINITAPQEGKLYGKIAPSFSVFICDPNLDKMWYSLNGGKNITFTKNETIDQTKWNKLNDGVVSIIFYANDLIGNTSSSQVSVIKDTQEPSISINYPFGGEIFYTLSPMFNVFINDTNLETMWYSLNSGQKIIFTVNGTINQGNWTLLKDGPVIITFYANDTAGNISWTSIIVYKDSFELLGGGGSSGGGSSSGSGNLSTFPIYAILIFIILIGVVFTIISRKKR